MTADLADLRDARARFLDLVRDLRPELHRYCARMTGSVVDGEDVVQDVLVHAYYALSELESLPELRPWLFRIAHNRAIDLLRRYDRRMREPLAPDVRSDAASVDDLLDEQLASRAALAWFVELPPSQRACVILKDVLGHSSKEIGELLDLGPGAVDACLHRGRQRLRGFAALAEDVRVDLVGHSQRAGAKAVRYFSNYAGLPPWRVEAGRLEGRDGTYVYAHPDDAVPAYFVEIVVADGAIAAIRDYRFVPYLLAERRVGP